MKQIVLLLAVTALFIVAVGLLSKNQGKFIGSFPSPTPIKEGIKIGDLAIQVEVADSGEKKAKGLSGRKSLGENEGMLFVFKNSYPSFWMKEMLIPIDILWISDGKVVKIHKDVQPEPGKTTSELTLYRPDQPIDYVLEVNAGFSDKNAVKSGDFVDLSGI